MAHETERTDPKLWERIKAEVTAGDKGGAPGRWSARKAQLAVTRYKHAGGGYVGAPDPHNHLKEWEEEDWGTRSGRPSGETHERYLPRAAREHLTPKQYDRTTAKKRADTAKGRQVSAQPEDVAEVAARYRHHDGDGRTKAELYALARRQGVPGRSRMTKAQLARAVGA